MYFINTDRATVIPLGCRLTWGLEHVIYLGPDVLYKIPNFIGRIWQPMDAKTTAEDLRIFDEFGLSIVPTVLHCEPVVQYGNGISRRVPYVMEQPYASTAIAVNMADLKNNRAVSEAVLDIALKSEAITARYPNRGVDFLGGSNWISSAKAMSPWSKSFEGKLNNLLILKEDMFAPRQIGEYIQFGDLLEPKGSVLQCDTRLFYSGSGGGFRARVKGFISDTSTHLEYGAVQELLEYIGIKYNPGKKSVRRTIGKGLVRLALPKIENYLQQAKE